MKTKLLLILGIIFITMPIIAQKINDEDKFNPFKIDDKMKYYKKEGYEYIYNYSFERVYNACKRAIQDLGCQVLSESYNQTDEGFYKGKVFSDYCVFASKSDTIVDALSRYSVRVPVIRGGVWVNGRMQYKFILTENNDGTTTIKLNGQISGREDYVTSKVHFWESNGLFEMAILERINIILFETQRE